MICDKAKERLAEKKLARECLVHKICPKCGEDLLVLESWDDGGLDMKCEGCNKKYTT